MTNESITYSDAIRQVEEILQQIESGELDVDQLAEKVKKAAELLKICRGKLFNTEQEINKILKDMDGEDKIV